MALSNTEKKELVFIPLKLLVICAAIALLVSFVNSITADKISANEAAKTNDALANAFPDAANFEAFDGEIEVANVVSAHEAFDSDGDSIGYAVICEPMGFKDVINMMVSFNTDKTIASVDIISLSETTGIGDKVKSSETFTAQFSGKSGELTVGKNVDAISGATISSKAVTAGVNSAVVCVNELYGNGGAANE